jgi:hypothetical protein
VLLKWASSYTQLHHVPVTFERCGSNMLFISRLPIILDCNEGACALLISTATASFFHDSEQMTMTTHSNLRLSAMPSCWNEHLRMTRTYDLHATSPQQLWFSFDCLHQIGSAVASVIFRHLEWGFLSLRENRIRIPG